ncbi:tetratricopeptide repeat protein [Streptomyces sp. SID3343]|uniref:tetratricopeptide repeat protein n=1 Tax=Streptomyces sp. SID3343 TaxID=2690260 RepID=UPI00136BD61F|nr:tetratricopeptide repeat protein [Streptomyces sp. SID3343]MYW05596.1 tetratricopeptide repeat protein [Streptomyces sp. SID3343]
MAMREDNGPREPLPNAPGDAVHEAEQVAVEAFDLGAAERTAGRVDAARAAFLRAAATGHPDIGPMALANLAVLEASAGRNAEARTAFRQAIATGHRDHAAKSLFNFGLFEKHNGEPAHARELYRQAIATEHPEHARTARFNLANLEVEQGRPDEACALLLRAMEPPFLADTASRAHRLLMAVAPGRLAEAREVYLRAAASEDEDTATHARRLLYDLDPAYLIPGDTIRLGTHTFDPADIESAEWAMGKRPGYSSGYLDIHTRGGGHHVAFVDLRDPDDGRGIQVLRRLLGSDDL